MEWENSDDLNRGEAHDSVASNLDDDQQDRQVISDTGEEEYREGGQEADHPPDDSQDGKKDRRKKKMEHAKTWIVNNLVFERNGVRLMPLCDISSKYFADCKRDSQEPLFIDVLCRLLFKQFGDLERRRFSYGKRKTHYAGLRWRFEESTAAPPTTTFKLDRRNSGWRKKNQKKVEHAKQFENSTQQCNSAAAPLTPTEDERAEKTPFEGSSSFRTHAESTEPQPVMGGRDVEEREQTTGGDLPSSSPSQSSAKNDDKGQKECEKTAAHLQQVVKEMFLQGKREILLKTFARSSSCYNDPCYSLCVMFRRMRLHLLNARHACRVLRIYSFLVKMHVATCVTNDCGLKICPVLRASKPIEQQEKKQQKERCVQQPAIKKPNVQDNNSLPPMSAHTTQTLQIILVPSGGVSQIVLKHISL